MAVKGISAVDEFAARWSLRGQSAVVTGGTRGIGRAIVEELAKLGARVYTCARSAEDLRRSLKEWEAAGLSVKGSVCDVSSREQREAFFGEVNSAFNSELNILVNNVGTAFEKPSVEYTAEDFNKIISTNLESAYHFSQLAHPLLKASGNGNIVFISSIAGLTAVISAGSIYATTKAALNQLTKNLACEWAKDKIRVNSVAPGYIKTDLTNQLMEDNQEFARQVISGIPEHRMGEPFEVASVVGFLCLASAAFLTGQTITVDGGMTTSGFYPSYDG